uniref:Uncharacterized protein n=1 Tax=Anguilla anguilla TaxID=7936 RepID=A0A0E9VK25_ANGAN
MHTTDILAPLNLCALGS